MDRENWIEFLNIITMDDENIEKFKKLYGEGKHIGGNTFPETLLSFSMVIPETSRNDADSDWVIHSNLQNRCRHKEPPFIYKYNTTHHKTQ